MATLDEQAKSINDLIDQAQKAVTDGDVETARKLKEEIEQAKATYNEQKEITDAVQSEEKSQVIPTNQHLLRKQKQK